VDKVILLSMLVVTFAFPALAARDPRPRRGLARLLLALLVFSALYVLLVTHVYARLYVPEWLPL
jgi:lipopolysaccharide export LptBFGC system permease protein LptF